MVDSPWTKLNDDIILHVFAALSIPDLYVFSKVCRQTWRLSHHRHVWVNACELHILQEGIPFPRCCLPSMSDLELRKRTIRAAFLAQNLRSSIPKVQKMWTIDRSPWYWNAKFLRTRGKTWIVVREETRNSFTLSPLDCTTAKVVCKYKLGESSGSMIINTNPHGRAMVMVKVTRKGRQMIEFLSIREEDNRCGVSFERVRAIDFTSWHPAPVPMALHGDVFASREGNQIIIRSLKTEERSFLNFSGGFTSGGDRENMAFLREDLVMVTNYNGAQTFIRQPGGFVAGEWKRWRGGMAGFRSCTFEPMLSCQGDGSPLMASILIQRNKISRKQCEVELYKVNGRSPDSEQPRGDNVLLSPLSLTSKCRVPWRLGFVISGSAGFVACVHSVSNIAILVFPGPYNQTNEVQLKVDVDVLDDGWHDDLEVPMKLDYDEMEGWIMAYIRGSRGSRLIMLSLCPLDRPLS